MPKFNVQDKVTWAYRSDMVMSVMPRDLAASYIFPSTSLDTALVHSKGMISLAATQDLGGTHRQEWQTSVGGKTHERDSSSN